MLHLPHNVLITTFDLLKPQKYAQHELALPGLNRK